MKLSFCAGQARRDDHDRYLCAMFAPAAAREALLALAAFNVEIAKTRDVVSEPALGRIRLAWWRETIDGVFAGTPRRHEVAAALAETVRRFDLPRAPFERMIAAYERELTSAPAGDLAALRTHAEDTAGAQTELWLRVLGAEDAASRAAGREVAVAWGLTGRLRAAAYDARAGRRTPPVKSLAEAAAAHLARARAERAPREALPALLPGILADAYLGLIARRGHDVLGRPITLNPAGRQLRLLIAAWRGRY